MVTHVLCTRSRKLRERRGYNTENPFMKPCSILDFHSEYYRSEIEILVFNLPCVLILGKNNCSGKQHDIFVSWHNKYDWKCTRDYEERHQVPSEQAHSQ